MSDHHQPMPCPIKHFTNTEMIVREDILKKAKELAELLTTSREVQFYQKAERQIAKNEHVQSLISAIKKSKKRLLRLNLFKMIKWSPKSRAR